MAAGGDPDVVVADETDAPAGPGDRSDEEMAAVNEYEARQEVAADAPPGVDPDEWIARKLVVMRVHTLAVRLLMACDNAESIEARSIRLYAQRTKMTMLDGVADPIELEDWMACQHAVDRAYGRQTVPVAVRAERPEDIGLVSA